MIEVCWNNLMISRPQNRNKSKRTVCFLTVHYINAHRSGGGASFSLCDTKRSTFLTTQRTFYSFYSVRKESISAGATVTVLLFQTLTTCKAQL